MKTGRAGKSKKYKTREICKIFDISKATLFRWESEGFISNVGRDWRNWRIYSARNIQEIRQIIRKHNSRG